mmetsp:Transcript_58407/g.136821  ORF Transcript_58407/g.136821 Transcript_58407/m.136821 type:complete len:347 (-) Transcript_58407:1655-2695(-)
MGPGRPVSQFAVDRRYVKLRTEGRTRLELHHVILAARSSCQWDDHHAALPRLPAPSTAFTAGAPFRPHTHLAVDRILLGATRLGLVQASQAGLATPPGIMQDFAEAILLAGGVSGVTEAPRLPVRQQAVPWRLDGFADLGFLQRTLTAVATLIVSLVNDTVPFTHEGGGLKPIGPFTKDTMLRNTVQVSTRAPRVVHLCHVGARTGVTEHVKEDSFWGHFVRYREDATAQGGTGAVAKTRSGPGPMRPSAVRLLLMAANSRARSGLLQPCCGALPPQRLWQLHDGPVAALLASATRAITPLRPGPELAIRVVPVRTLRHVAGFCDFQGTATRLAIALWFHKNTPVA